MTLNLTLTTPRYLIQISDRRLSRIDRGGQILSYTDDLNKATLLVTQDAFAAITYHGLGMDHTGLRADDWLVDHLTDMKPIKMPIRSILDRLAERSTEWVSDIAASSEVDRRLLRHSFVLSAWHRLEDPYLFLVSNYEDQKSHERSDFAWQQFRWTFSRPKPGSERAYALKGFGDTGALPMSDSVLLARLAQDPGAKPEDLVNILVRSLRAAARTSTSVSPDCVSVLVQRGETVANCKYHSFGEESVIHAPHYVGPFTMSHIQISLGRPDDRDDESG